MSTRKKRWLGLSILLICLLTGAAVYAAKSTISLNSPVSFPVDI